MGDEAAAPSIHDNVLVAYEVLLDRREVRLHTHYPWEPEEHTDVIFTGVECYDFQNDSVLGTILFAIEEEDPLALFRCRKQDFLDRLRYGWPGEWAKSEETALKFFDTHGIRCWVIASSVGMSGWILARACRVVPRSDPWKPEDA